MPTVIPSWKITGLKLLYNFCSENNLDISQKDIGVEFDMSHSSISYFEKKLNLKRTFNRKKEGRYIIDSKTDCWIWQLYCDRDGYAMESNTVNRKRIAYQVHKYNYEQKYGKVSDGMVLDHVVCKNPSCVNPDHLEVVTNTENVRRGRSTKLSREDVLEIRKLHAAKICNQKQLAKKFNVGEMQISRIINRHRWKDV
jgi:hypothetical protein